MNLELFLAKRLYSTRKGTRRLSRPAVTIAQWGVTIGTIVMFLSISIIVGFKSHVREKVIGFGGHIQILNFEKNSEYATPITVDSTLTQELFAVNGTRQVQQYVQIPGIILSGGEYEGIVLKGVGGEYDLSFYAGNIVEGMLPTFGDSAASNEIVISRATARRLNLKSRAELKL